MFRILSVFRFVLFQFANWCKPLVEVLITDSGFFILHFLFRIPGFRQTLTQGKFKQTIVSVSGKLS